MIVGAVPVRPVVCIKYPSVSQMGLEEIVVRI